MRWIYFLIDEKMTPYSSIINMHIVNKHEIVRGEING
jgi:hypothetical protein